MKLDRIVKADERWKVIIVSRSNNHLAQIHLASSFYCLGMASGIEKPRGLFDMERHYVFYGSYHNDRVNQLIHIVFVWPILFATFLLLQYTPTLYSIPSSLLPSLPQFLSPLLVINGAAIGAAMYVVFYTAMGKGVGPVAAALVIACWLASRALFDYLGTGVSWKVGNDSFSN